MPPDAEPGSMAVYVADMAFFVGLLGAPVLFALGYVFDALIALAMVVAGAAYSLHQGQPWPGHAFISYWRRLR